MMGKEAEDLFFIFVFWSALIVGGSGVAGWSRKSSLKLAETASFCFCFYSRMEDTG